MGARHQIPVGLGAQDGGTTDAKVLYKDEEPFTTKHKKLDSSKAIRDLGHNPSTPLEEGITETVCWMGKIYGRA